MLNGRLDLEVGKSNVHQYFFVPNSLDPFTYDAPLLNVNADFNSIPYALWMGKATYKLTGAWYLQSAVFEDNYLQAVKYGWTFGDRSAPGVQLINEFGYRTDFSTEYYPANLEAGLVWNTRRGYNNQKGTGVLASPSTTAADYKGGGVIVLQGATGPRARPDPVRMPPVNLQAYDQVDVALDKIRTPFDLDASVGLNLTGGIPFRPSDILGIQARYLRLSALEAAFETAAHTLVNGGRFAGTQSRDAFQFEASYQIKVTRYATLSLYGQYYLHPDDNEVAVVNHVPASGFEAGTLLRIPLGPLLGTSSNPL